MQRPRPIRWFREHPRGADAALAAIISALALVLHLVVDPEAIDETDQVRDPTWWTVLLTLCATVPIAWRRTHTYIAAGIVVTAQIVSTITDSEGGAFLGVIVMLYSLGAHRSGVVRTRVVTAIVVAILLLFVAGLLVDELNLAGFISSVVVLVTAFVVGDNIRRRREQVASLAERAERAEREQQLLAERRVAAERARIARELHDVVAHSVSVMVIQSAAARRSLTNDPDRASETLLAVEETGRTTMNELRSILGVLRSESDDQRDTVPQPSLSDVPALIDADGDIPVHLEVSGNLDTVPSGVGLTAYRIVQEALTNVRRHAGPVDRVDVTIGTDGYVVSITVADDGRGAAADPADGFGLIGMRERAASLGGSVTAGPRSGGGWIVRAELPIGGAHHPVDELRRPDRSDPPADESARPDDTAAASR
jgi:signal transduction histidine kinase